RCRFPTACTLCWATIEITARTLATAYSYPAATSSDTPPALWFRSIRPIATRLVEIAFWSHSIDGGSRPSPLDREKGPDVSLHLRPDPQLASHRGQRFRTDSDLYLVVGGERGQVQLFNDPSLRLLSAGRRTHRTRQATLPVHRAHALYGRMNAPVEHLNACGRTDIEIVELDGLASRGLTRKRAGKQRAGHEGANNESRVTGLNVQLHEYLLLKKLDVRTACSRVGWIQSVRISALPTQPSLGTSQFQSDRSICFLRARISPSGP